MSLLRDLSLEEAKALATSITELLAARNIHPYSVRKCAGYDYVCLPNADMPIRVLNHRKVCAYYWGVRVKVDVAPSVGRHEIQEFVPGYYEDFVLLRCGLVDFVSKEVRQRVCDWNWAEPEQWRNEREAWRKGQVVSVNAAIRDYELLQVERTRVLKRRWEQVVDVVKDARDEDKETQRMKKQRKE